VSAASERRALAELLSLVDAPPAARDARLAALESQDAELAAAVR
jgi:hypothetical protein